MNGKKILLWALIAFAVWMVFTNPLQAAGIVHSGENTIGHGAKSGSTFLSHSLPSSP